MSDPMPAMQDDHAMDDELIEAGRRIVALALAEDLSGPDGSGAGDITSHATIPAEVRGEARLVVRAPGVIAGLGLVAEVYRQIDDTIDVDLFVSDGDRVAAGTVAATIAGPLGGVLTGERTALNLVGHLSGVATATDAYVTAIAGTGCIVRDTRKTTPGLRLLEKAAVRAGGGRNHRVGLFDAILVKDNHVAVAGSVTAASRAALSFAEATDVVVQIEVDTLDQLDEALAAGASEILLDNFTPAEAAEAVARVKAQVEGQVEAQVETRALTAGATGAVILEASGGIDLTTVRAYAEAGVDYVSVGAITHSAPQLDVALDIDSPAARRGA
ncbi:MAG: carboxylating nicotinate-nucleotide diphosphorylase [Nitriliruptoraceae bacterium]